MKLTRWVLAGLVSARCVVPAMAADNHAPVTAAHGPAADKTPAPDVVMEWLRYGNERHVQGKYVHWHQSAERRKEVAAGQHPHAIVLACADSRVPPEILFDQGIGDLFVVRVAGNVVGEKELGSIEYAAEHLGVPLLIVLGHQRCGAVQAAVKGGDLPGHIGSLVASLSPAVARVKGMPGDAVDHAIHANVQMVSEGLQASEPLLGHLVRSGRLRVAGAYYNLDTGEVEWESEGGPRAPSVSRVSALPH